MSETIEYKQTALENFIVSSQLRIFFFFVLLSFHFLSVFISLKEAHACAKEILTFDAHFLFQMNYLKEYLMSIINHYYHHHFSSYVSI